jgi:hypothetical protein
MSRFRVFLAAGFVATALSASLPARTQDGASPRAAGVHDFDFFVGEWRVHHRRLTPDGREWLDFEGTACHRKLMGGEGNLEEHALDAPKGAYRAVALRSYDSKTGLWAIWWLDERRPSGPIGPPVKGRFENGIGTFYADYTHDGKPVRVRFIWSQITATSARWEQAYSPDAGKTWETNWIMEFRRST